MVLVGQKGKAEAVRLVELLLRCRSVGADPDDGSIQFRKIFPSIPDAERLRRSAGGESLWIEVEKEFPAFEVGESYHPNCSGLAIQTEAPCRPPSSRMSACSQ